MEIKIKSIHFDATEQLKNFIEKKVEKLGKTYDDIRNVEVQLKVVKPATAMNKEASLSISISGTSVFVEKVCDTFEEAIDQCVDAAKVKLTKIKEKMREN